MSEKIEKSTKKRKNIDNNLNEGKLKEDCMELVRVQNKKIKSLFDEVEKKDKLLCQYQIQLKNMTELSDENNYLKSQIDSLNTKFKTQLESLKESYNKEIEQYLSEIKEKEEINHELLIDLENIKKLLDENKKKFEKMQNDHKLNIEKINKSITSEKDYQSKAKELVNIIESQDVEIKKFNDVVGNLQNIIQNTKSMNQELNDQNTTLQQQNAEHENTIINMNETIENLQNKLNNNNSELKVTKEEKDKLYSDYQNTLNSLNLAEKELKNLKTNNEKLIQNNEQNNNFHKNFLKNLFDFLTYYKTVMDSGFQWAETYIHPGTEEADYEFFIGGNEMFKNTIDNNFNMLKNDSVFVIQLLSEVYLKFSGLLKNIHNNIKEEYHQLLKENTEQKDNNSQLLQKINMIEKDNVKLKGEFHQNMLNDKETEDIINNLKNEIDSIRNELANQQNNTQNYENDIFQFYQEIIDFIKSNIELFKTNKSFNNIFRLQALSLFDDSNPSNQMSIIREYCFNFAELSLNIISDVEKQSNIIKDYNKLKEEHKKIKSELLQIKKEYALLKKNYDNEREKVSIIIQNEKEKEIKIIKNEEYEKVNGLNKIIKTKEEEIEKLSNDNNILYSQYIMCQNNFDQYKETRKKDDKSIQDKISDLMKTVDSKNKEIKKYKDEKEILLNKSKLVENSLIKKSKEVESLVKKIESLKK